MPPSIGATLHLAERMRLEADPRRGRLLMWPLQRDCRPRSSNEVHTLRPAAPAFSRSAMCGRAPPTRRGGGRRGAFEVRLLRPDAQTQRPPLLSWRESRAAWATESADMTSLSENLPRTGGRSRQGQRLKSMNSNWFRVCVASRDEDHHPAANSRNPELPERPTSRPQPWLALCSRLPNYAKAASLQRR